ncbi:MAG TPA: AraC family transcriptional regulator [Myxococcaceae bacterium]
MEDAEPATEFGASLASSLNVGGILVSLLDYSPGTRTSPHENGGTCLTFTLRGAWRIHHRPSGAHDCSRGIVHLVPIGVRHHSLFDGNGVRILALYVGEERWAELKLADRGVERVCHFRDGQVEALAERMLREMNAGDELRLLALEGLALEMIAQSARPHWNIPGERRSRWLATVEERLRAEFRAPPSLRELACDAGVHPVHLARSFRARTGYSVGAFVRKLRLDWAEGQLLETSRSLAELSAEAGFADQSHFTRLFRARTGLAPACYRRTCRGEPGSPEQRQDDDRKEEAPEI